MTAAITLPLQPHSDWLARLRTIGLGLGGRGVMGLGLGRSGVSAAAAEPPAYVQSVEVFANSGLTASGALTATAGNLLVLLLGWTDDVTISGVADTTGNSWQAVSSRVGSFSRWVQIWYAMGCAVGANTVTATFSADAGAHRGGLHEYSGIATSSALDQQTNADGIAVTSLNSGNVTTTTANSLLVAIHMFNATSGGGEAVGANWTLRQSVFSRGFTQDRIVSATGTYSADLSWTTARNAHAQIAAFKGN